MPFNATNGIQLKGVRNQLSASSSDLFEIIRRRKHVLVKWAAEYLTILQIVANSVYIGLAVSIVLQMSQLLREFL